MCYHTETLNQSVVLSELCDMEILKYFDFAELRKIARLALPIFLGSMASMGMAFTDTVMAGHLSAADLALRVRPCHHSGHIRGSRFQKLQTAA